MPSKMRRSMTVGYLSPSGSGAPFSQVRSSGGSGIGGCNGLGSGVGAGGSRGFVSGGSGKGVVVIQGSVRKNRTSDTFL